MEVGNIVWGGLRCCEVLWDSVGWCTIAWSVVEWGRVQLGGI